MKNDDPGKSPKGGEFEKTFTEKEPTCPGGGYMRWRVRVNEPDTAIGEQLAMISIDEESTTDASNKDSLLLDLDAARWLLGTLYEAIARAEAVQSKAEKEAQA